MMRKFMLGISALNPALARNYPHISDDSFFKIFDFVCFQLDAARTIRFENHLVIPNLTLRIKPLIIFGDDLSKSLRIGIEQGISEPVKCQHELFF